MPAFQKIKTRLFRFVLSVCVLVAVLSISVPLLIDTAVVKDFFFDTIYRKAGIRMTARHVDIHLYPFPHLSLDHIRLTADEQLSCRMDRAVIYPDLSALLKGKPAIRKLVVQQPVIASAGQKKSGTAGELLLPLASNGRMLDKLFVFFHETGGDLRIENFRHDFFESCDASLFIDPGTKRVTGNIRVTGLSLNGKNAGDWIPADRQIHTDEIAVRFSADATGRAEAAADILNGTVQTDRGNRILHSRKATAFLHMTDLKIRLGLKPTVLSEPSVKAAASFTCDRKRKRGSVTFILENGDIEALKMTSEGLFGKTGLSRNLFDILRKGDIPACRVSFTDSPLTDLFDVKRLTINGDAANASVKIPGTQLITQAVSGRAVYENGVLQIDVAKGRIKKSKIKSGHLEVNLTDHPAHPFKGAFGLTARLSDIQEALMSLMPGSRLSRELALVNNVTGTAGGELRLERTGPETLNVGVTARDIKGSGDYKPLFGRIEIDDGTFLYRDRTVTLEKLTGSINDGTFTDIGAKIDLKQDGFIDIESGSARFDMKTVYPWLLSYNLIPPPFPGINIRSGTVVINEITAQGPLFDRKNLNYDISGTGETVVFENQITGEDILSLDCRFHLTDRWKRAEEITARVERTDLLSELSGISILKKMNLPVRLRNGRIEFREDSSVFNGLITFKSGPEIRFASQTDPQGKYYLEKLEISEGKLSSAVFLQDQTGRIDVTAFKGQINTGTLEKIFKENCDISRKIASVTGEQTFLIKSENGSVYTVLARHVDFALLKSHLPGKAEKKNLSEADKEFRIETDIFTYKKQTLEDLAAAISFRDGKTLIDIEKASLCGANLTGNAVRKNAHTGIWLNFEKRDGYLARLTACFFNKPDLADGRYTLEGRVHATGNTATVGDNFSGDLDFSATGGRIYRLTLLSRILSVINVSKFAKGTLPDIRQNGFAYNAIDITAKIQDSRIFLEKAVIDGEDMMLVFRGWIDPASDTIDLTCLIAPFKTVDLLIEKIPVLNTLLDGRLASIPVKATGSINDPSVVPLHPSSVGEGLVNIMKNILNTPVKLLESLP